MTDRPASPRLLEFRSGGWVLLLAGALVVAVGVWLLRPVFLGGSAVPGPSEASPDDYDLTALAVPRSTLVPAGIARDGLETLVDPAVWTVEESDRRNREERGKYLVGHDWVIGVALAGESRAYPLRLLNWHEVVQDRLGGRSLAVVFSPLTRTVRVLDRGADGETLDLRVSGILSNSQTLLYDRGPDGEPRSLWDPLTARAVAGPAAAAGARLPTVPASLTTWEAWRKAHPGTTVVRPGERLAKLYRRDPYGNYYMTGHPRFPVEPMPPEGGLPPMTPVAVFDPDGAREVLPLVAGRAADGSPPLSADFSRDVRPVERDGWLGLTLVGEGAPPDVLYTTWFGWYAATGADPGTIVRLP